MNKLLAIVLGIIPLLAQAQQASTAICLRIQGKIIDQATHQPLAAARLVAQTDKGQISVGISEESGKFSGVLPCGTTTLLIKRANYRTQTLPIQSPNITSENSVVILIPLVSVDKQGTDTPYLQTEQTSYVQLDNSSAGQSIPDSNRIQHNLFLVTDAIQKKPVSATVCFFFTKSKAKQCLETNAAGWLPIDFKQKDIVALEVSAAGYQSYAGNMVIEQLDGRSLKHEIRLQRELTTLTIHAPDANQCELQSETQTILLTPLVGYTNQYVAYDLEPGTFKLIVKYPTQQVQRSIQMHSGLNVTAFTQPRTPALLNTTRTEVTASNTSGIYRTTATTLLLPDTIPMIYFEQGSYQLRTDSQAVLMQVANYMKAHPTCSLQVTGHTDNVGNPQVNQTLSLYRARATTTFLASQGISENRLIKDGLGSSHPLAPNTTEANRVLNRRVSIKLITTP